MPIIRQRIRFFFLLMVVLLVLLQSTTFASKETECSKAYSGGDFKKAFKVCLPLAKGGDPEAQFNLGMIYALGGEDIAQNDNKAAKWLLKAAEQGYADAQCNMGTMLANGRGIAQNNFEAVKWYRKAAEQGQVDAQYNLGLHYGQGKGVSQDDKEAVSWYRKAAQQGMPLAQFKMGVMHSLGISVPKNDFKAVEWYRKAALQGNSNAQYNLGAMYVNGKGVRKNYDSAYIWFNLAAAQGHEQAKTAIKQLNTVMPPAQIATAWKRATDIGDLLDQVGLCELQERLFELGFYQEHVDGQMGTATATAISEYELKNKLRATGFPSKSLLSAIRLSYEALNKQPKNPDHQTSYSSPHTGTIFQDNLPAGIAPLEVVTADKGFNFFVKVQQDSDEKVYKTFFLRGGETLKTNLPLGSYIIKYAAGKTWYGQRCFFGISTVFSKAEKVFRFGRQGNRVTGFRVELILQRDGNLSTSAIPRNQF